MITERKKEKKRIIQPSPLTIEYPIVTDPLGMYTGLVSEGDDKPEQDADDL